MVKKLREYQTPLGYSKENIHPKAKILAREVEEMENEIIRLVDSLAGAGETLTNYINRKVEEIDQARQEKMKEMIALSDSVATPAQLERIVASLSNWEQASFEEKQFALDKLVDYIRVRKGCIEIAWKI